MPGEAVGLVLRHSIFIYFFPDSNISTSSVMRVSFFFLARLEQFVCSFGRTNDSLLPCSFLSLDAQPSFVAFVMDGDHGGGDTRNRGL